jgi:hypothetical protein
MKEDETLWGIGRGFLVRNLPWTEDQLRKLPPFEFENWAVIALGGRPNIAKVGDMGIDGRIYPVSSMPAKSGQKAGELGFMDDWYPIQVKQKDQIGRPDVDAFEAVMMREDRKIGYMVSFDFSSDAMREMDEFLRRSGKQIKAYTVNDLLEGNPPQKMV